MIARRAAMGLVLALLAACVSPRILVAQQEPSWDVFDADDPTPQPVVDAMLRLANVGAQDVVYDLGCGDGRIVIAAARKFGSRGVCIDISPKMIAQARANAQASRVADKLTFIEGDLFKADLGPASVITLFLWDTMNVRLRPRLLDLAPGTRIVSHEHDMAEWRPDRTISVDSKSERWGERTLHLWIVPARIAGEWLLTENGRSVTLGIEQQFQALVGTATEAGRSQPLRNGRLTGYKVRFELTFGGKPRRYAGRVTALDTIEGEGWSAKRRPAP